jgi:hypothetical protein
VFLYKDGNDIVALASVGTDKVPIFVCSHQVCALSKLIVCTPQAQIAMVFAPPQFNEKGYVTKLLSAVTHHYVVNKGYQMVCIFARSDMPIAMKTVLLFSGFRSEGSVTLGNYKLASHCVWLNCL